MIEKAFQFTAQTLNQFIKNKFGLDDDAVLINRIIEQNGKVPEKNKNHIVLSLIHVEEETTKQFFNRMQPVSDGNYAKKPLANRYNLFMLVTPNFDDYSEALKFLSATMQFFQTNELIDATKYANIPEEIGKLEYEFQKGDGYMQMQNLWTALGAKYQPSIIYKIRMITIASDEIEGFEPKIDNIGTNANPTS
ncbi:DUF4255 domain-containing protein [uncultured Kordia sp.]|uniref:DUF4255 domain-containing protein n=1 Tax=uncultured Kordia sp. TaxID=507699 RepID=UPI0026252EC6|nr:DUF4255 domain-containing protein [uncultured Kordia sp.]